MGQTFLFAILQGAVGQTFLSAIPVGTNIPVCPFPVAANIPVCHLSEMGKHSCLPHELFRRLDANAQRTEVLVVACASLVKCANLFRF